MTQHIIEHNQLNYHLLAKINTCNSTKRLIFLKYLRYTTNISNNKSLNPQKLPKITNNYTTIESFALK